MTMTVTEEAPLLHKLNMAQNARAVFKQLVAGGQEKLTPENVAALRELDAEIAATRKFLGLKDKP